MAIGDYRFNERSRRSVREQWGPSPEEERSEALRRMMDRGETPSSFGSMEAFEAARRREIQAERDRRGEMSYDTSQGKLVPSIKARKEKLEAQIAADKKNAEQAIEAKKKGDETWKNEVVSEIASDGPGRMGVTKDGQQIYQEATPSGGFVSIKGKQVTDNLLASREREREEAQKNEEFQANLTQLRRDRAINRLTDSGYDWKSADSAELFNENGTLNLDRAKRAADLAQGRKAQATFDSWDADRELERRAVAMEKDARSERSYLRRAQRGAFGLQAQREAQSSEGRRRISKLENDLSAGESDPAGLKAGFWREEAEKVDAAGTERRAAVRNLQEADEARAKSLMQNATNLAEAMARLYKDFEEGKITEEQMEIMSAYMGNNYGGNN